MWFISSISELKKTFLFKNEKGKTSSQNIHLLVLEVLFFFWQVRTDKRYIEGIQKEKTLLKFKCFFAENPKKWKCSEKETSELFL